MTGFLIAAAVAVLLALALLLRPFFSNRGAVPVTSQRQFNAAIYRDQLARLEQDLAEGTLSPADSAQARAELQRRVLQDTAQADAAPTLRAPRRTFAAIALLLPAAAFGVYFAIGSPASMNPQPVAAGAPQDVQRMVDALAAKLERDPSNLKGWAMLARSYKVMGRPQEAERAFEQAGAFVESDAQLLADYADVAAANAAGNFSGKPARLIAQSLRLDPQHPMALWLSGTASLNAGRPKEAVATWNTLMQLLQPGSNDARMLQSALDDVRGRSGESAQPTAALIQVASGASVSASVSGKVELAPALKSKMGGDDTVMVIARLPGSRMPVAVLRVRAAQLPMAFTLDDSLAMSPQSLISTAGEVEVEARISRSGQARAEAGDLLSPPQTVKVGTRGVTLNVAQVRP